MMIDGVAAVGGGAGGPNWVGQGHEEAQQSL